MKTKSKETDLFLFGVMSWFLSARVTGRAGVGAWGGFPAERTGGKKPALPGRGRSLRTPAYQGEGVGGIEGLDLVRQGQPVHRPTRERESHQGETTSRRKR